MNRDETILILGLLKAAYPKTYAEMTKEQAHQTVALWAEMFEDDDFNVIKRSVKNHINSEMWPPSISQIRAAIVDVCNPTLRETAGQAWEMVLPKLSNPGRRDPEGGMAKLSECARQVCRSMGWEHLCNCTDLKWERERFIKMYDEIKDSVRSKVAQGQTINGAIGIEGPKNNYKQLEAPKYTVPPQKDMTAETGSFRRHLEETMERTGMTEAEVMRELKSKIGVQHCRDIQAMLKGCVGASERPQGYWKGK